MIVDRGRGIVVDLRPERLLMDDTLTMRDIGQVAGVTRQAVTNWRSRSIVRGQNMPFPAPVRIDAGVEEFDRKEILAWLHATGRGQNVEATIDAPAMSIPRGAELDHAVTVLALALHHDGELGELTAPERVALAARIDPNNKFLLSEIQSLADHDELVRYIDVLRRASFGASDALNRLYLTRLARRQGDRGLTDQFVDLLADLTRTCREHKEPEKVAIDLQIDHRARRVAHGFQFTRPSTNSSHARAGLRHLVVDGIQIIDSASAVVHVISAVGLQDQNVLQIADQTALDLAPNDIALLLGPASALCDPLRGRLASLRSQTLQIGSLVAALRLPRGMWRNAHRQNLALWAFKGGANAQRIIVADLVGQAVNSGDLASDLAGALEQSTSRGYRYGRAIRHQDVRGRAPVVATGVRAIRLLDAGAPSHADRVNAATLVTREPLGSFDVLVSPVPPVSIATPRSLGEIVEARKIDLHSGCRVDETLAEPSGTVRMLSAIPGSAVLLLDPLVVAKHYRHARRTKPGDVVFVGGQRPAAIVDEFGDGLVLTPSRILRLPTGAPIGPRALAEVINHLPEGAGEWGTWTIPQLTADQIQAVEHTLAIASRYASELRRREVAMGELVTNLIDGLAVGGLSIATAATT